MSEDIEYEHTSCTLCGATNASLWLKCKDRGLGSFSMQKCIDCGLIYINPRPKLKCMGHYYPDDYSCFEPPKGILPWLKNKIIGGVALEYLDYNIYSRMFIRKAALFPFRHTMRRLPPYKNNGKLLDIGCGIGKDLDIYKAFGWETYGVEINGAAASYAKNNGHNVSLGVLEDIDFPDHYFDAITLWDVIEHLHYPIDTLKRINRLLNVNGYLILRTPNCDSLQARWFGNKWGAASHVPQHLFFFSPTTISNAAVQCNFSVDLISTTSTPFGIVRVIDRIWRDMGLKHSLLLKLLKLISIILGVLAWPIILMTSSGDFMTVHLRKMKDV